MDEQVIPHLDEADIRSLAIRCALESYCAKGDEFGTDELIAFAMEIEHYIDGGGDIRFTCDPKLAGTAG